MPVSPEVAALVARQNARHRAGAIVTPDSPRTIREPHSGVEKFLDYLSRPEYASANFFGAILRGGPDINPLSEAWEGITGRKRYDFIQLANEQLGLSNTPFFNVPDIKFVPDVVEEITESLLSPSGLTGLALGFALDPLSWVAPLKLTKAGQLARVTKGALSEQGMLLREVSREAARIQKLHGLEAAKAWLLEQAPRFRALKLPTKDLATGQMVMPAEGYIKAGSKLAREWEEHFQRTGQIPEALANTLADQAGKGQLSLLSLVTPTGQNLIEGPAGMPVMQAATRLGELARQNPQVKAALQLFSHFNIPEAFMSRLAEWRAQRRMPVEAVEKTLRATYKVLDLGATTLRERKRQVRTMLEAMDVGGQERLNETRLASAARTGSVTDRVLGTGDFLRKTDLEMRGTVTPELAIVRQELGLGPTDPLINRIPVPQDEIPNLEQIRAHQDFIGVELHMEQPGQHGATRILIDRDARPSVDTLKKQLLEVDRLLRETADTVEVENLHAQRAQLQRSLGYALDDPLHSRPWRMIVYAKPQGPTAAAAGTYGARTTLATEVPVVVGRSSTLAELAPFVDELTQGTTASVNVLEMPKNVSQAYIRRVQAMDPVDHLLAERARLAGRVKETMDALAHHTQNYTEAYRLATENLDPDLLQLERVDRALERLGMGAIRLGQGIGTPKKGTVIDLPKARSLLATIDMGRFAGMPDITRTVALEMEELLDNMWGVEAKRGINRSRLANYVPRIRNEDFALTPWIRGFAQKGPIVTRKMPFSQHREFMREVGLRSVNQHMNREYFLEDLMTGIGLRGVASARAIAYHDFVNKTLDQFSIRKITNAREAAQVRAQYLDTDYALFYPKGTVTWYPTQIVSNAAVRRGQERAGAMGRQGLVELTEDEIKQGYGASWNAPAHLMKREVADYLNRVDQVANTDQGIQLFANTIRQFRGIWSKWTLFWFPGFIARNVVGNIANMLYSGFRDPKLFKIAQDIQRGKNWSGVSLRGEALTQETILKEASRNGPIDSGWAMSEFFSETDHGRREWNFVKRFQDASITGKKTMLQKSDPRQVMGLMMRVNGWMENNSKLALYIDRRLKGDSAEQAAATVRKYLFDYDEIRPAERALKSYVLPYYVWTRKNIPLQFEMAARRPAYFANLARAKRLLEASSNPAVETLPQWMHEALPVRLKESEDTPGSFEYLTLRGWLPAAEIETAFSPFHSAMGMLGPWLRIPVERKANYSFWFRRPIEQPKGQKGYFLGLSLDRSDIEILSTIRLLSEIDRIMPAPASSPLAGFQAPVWDRVMSSSLTGIGLKTYQVNMHRQRKIAKAQQERILRELRIHLNRARKRHDMENVALLSQMIQDEERRNPDVVLPLSITGLPTEP